MRSVEKSSRTQEEAVQEALQELNASISDVKIEVLDEGSKGLFGLFGSRLARVRVTLLDSGLEDELDSILQDTSDQTAPAEPVSETVSEPVRKPVPQPAPVQMPESVPVNEAPQEEEKPAPARPEPVRRTRSQSKKERQPKASDKPAQEKKKPSEKPAQEQKNQTAKAPVSPMEKPVVTMLDPETLDPQSPAGKTYDFLREITRLMGVEVTVSVGTDEEGNVYGRMVGDTLGILIGRRGETLDALQYLTSLRVNRTQDTYTRVTLDTEDYRARREDTLIRLANRMANRAVRTGRRVSLEPMNPYERRIIHSALQANEAVDTHSEGDEPNRHVVITLKK